MKKVKVFILIELCFLMICCNVKSVSALTHVSEDILNYQKMIDDVNIQYGKDYSILSEVEYREKFEPFLKKSYSDYIQGILNTDINELRIQLIQMAISNDEIINVTIDRIFRSSYGTKTVNFNNGANRMTLSYKYSGSTFDTGYKPTASVSVINYFNYFVMDSYSGSFKNSNKTYSVVAKGRIITASGIASSKSFTVNFDL